MVSLSAPSGELSIGKSRVAQRLSAAVASRRTRLSLAVAVWAFALFGMAQPAAAQPAFVQVASQDPSAGSTVAVTYTVAQTAGDLNVVVIGWADSTSAVNSVTDSSHNVYLVAAGPTTSVSAWTPPNP